jgi:hypothetical protein
VGSGLNTSDEDLIGTREVAGIGTKRETVTNVITLGARPWSVAPRVGTLAP